MAQGREIDPKTGKPRSWVASKLANTRFDRGVDAALGAGAVVGVGGAKSYAENRAATQKARSEHNTRLNSTASQANLKDAYHELQMQGDGSDPYFANPEKLAAAQQIVRNAKPEDLEWARQNLSGFAGAGDSGALVRGAMSKKQQLEMANKSDISPGAKQRYQQAAYEKERAALAAKSAAIKEHGDVNEASIDVNEAGITDVEKARRIAEKARRIAAHAPADTQLQDIAKDMSLADLKNNATLVTATPEILKYVSPDNYDKFVTDRIEAGATSEDLGRFGRARYDDVHGQLAAVATAQLELSEQGITPEQLAERREAVKAARNTLKATLRSKDNLDLELLGPDIHNDKNFAAALTQQGYEHLTKTKKAKFAPAQLSTWINNRTEYFENALNDSDSTAFNDEISWMGPKQVASLHPRLLANKKLLNHMDTRTLNEIMYKSEVPRDTVETIRKNIEEEAARIGQEYGDSSHMGPITEGERNVVKLKEWMDNPRTQF